jgi:predicted anti-sigma-YlaC factor YlaD
MVMKPDIYCCCRWFTAVLVLLVGATGCSLKRVAVNKVGNALAGGGTTFSSDDDPELVRDAAPFSLKLMETLLNESPRHQPLLLALASGFTQYAFAFVQQDADRLEATDLEAAWEAQARARRLYLRARNYGLRGLEIRYPGIESNLRADPRRAVERFRPADVPLLYWTAASWAAAVSLAKDDAALIAEMPVVEALMDRALVLDEDFGDGAIHSFLITYEMARPGAAGDPAERSTRHFERAMQLSGGRQAGPLVSMAEAVMVQKQDLERFKSLLERAIAIDPDAQPEWRLANLIMQRRAKWLLSRTDELFLTRSSSADAEVP